MRAAAQRATFGGLPAPGRHALSVLRPALARRPLHTTASLRQAAHGATVEIVGQVVSRQRPGTAKGMTFLALSDEEGLINLVVPPAVYARDPAAIRGEALVWARGVVERRDGMVMVRAVRVRPLAEVIAAGEGERTTAPTPPPGMPAPPR